jgi:hypothetical protein
VIEVTVRFGGKPVTLMIKDHGIPLGTDKTAAEIFEAMRNSFHMTKQRCYNEKCPDYRYYGGRGIVVCDRWLESPLNVLADMGLRPKAYTLERKNNDGPYSVDNCKWATRAAQGLNTRQTKLITYCGETLPVAEWERRSGFKPGTLKARLGPLGYSVEEAFSKQVKCGELLSGREYPHLVDQSWRTVEAMHANPQKPVLSNEQIEHVRRLHSELAMTFTTIGKLFGVCTQTASEAVRGVGTYERIEYAAAA